MHPSLILLCLSLLAAGAAEAQSAAQGIAVRLDERGRFLLWENGSEQLITQHLVQDYQTAPDYLAYLDQAGELHRVEDGQNRALGVVNPEFWQARPGLLHYQLRGMHSLVQGNKKFRLGFQNRGDLVVGDSIAGFKDVSGALVAFHRGRFQTLESLMVTELQAGQNTLTWLNPTGQFWAYWNGSTGILDGVAPEKSALGCDVIAWADRMGALNIFDKGQKHKPQNGFQPDSVYAARGIVAWFDDRGEFYVWEAGQTIRLSDQFPRQFGVVDRGVWMIDANGDFYVYQHGSLERLETYEPMQVMAWDDIVIYQDLDGRLYGYRHGERYVVSQNIAMEWRLNGNLVQWSERPFHADYFVVPASGVSQAETPEE